MKSIPYRCPACMKPEACGFNGQLVFGRKTNAPTCRHNEKPGKPCHEGPVKMEPSREA
jgi:hypothetical protein